MLWVPYLYFLSIYLSCEHTCVSLPTSFLWLLYFTIPEHSTSLEACRIDANFLEQSSINDSQDLVDKYPSSFGPQVE